VRFLGTATISFDDGHTVIMTDGFFSRPSLARVLFGTVKPNEQRIREALQRAHLTRVAAIFVGHSHYDHAMDTAIVAERTGAISAYKSMGVNREL
jgi:L-ascorbate metabolism protein UlaG (beta-lactamase superfamily)